MWEYAGYIGKAQLYFGRGREHPQADDNVLAVWLLLGLEFLLRAPLAKVNPTLLADPSGDSIMHAAGFTSKLDGSSPKSIQTKTVILRLGIVIPEFTKERQDDATFLTGLRNEELHGSNSTLDVDIATWLPSLIRVIETICTYLDIAPEDITGDELLSQGRALVDSADRKLEHDVNRRVADAKAFFEHLRREEIEARRALIPKRTLFSSWLPGFPNVTFDEAAAAIHELEHSEYLQCPACVEMIPLRVRATRSTNERLEDDEIIRDIVYIAESLACPVCDLRLSSTAEIRAAGLAQQYIRTERVTIYQRFTDTYEPDYGND